MGKCAAKERGGVELQRSRGSKTKTRKKNKSKKKMRQSLDGLDGLTSLMAVQNSLWRTFFRDWSLWPGTSPDSCSFSSSSIALATSGRVGGGGETHEKCVQGEMRAQTNDLKLL